MIRLKEKWLVLFAICLITLMLGIDATALNIAIPVIADEFYASLISVQWVINIFFLGTAVVQILGGVLGDVYGNRKIFLLHLVLFTIASLGAGLSPGEGVLVFFRALQGISIGIVYPITMVLILFVFPKEEVSFARSFIVVTMGIALAVGAPIGGIFVHTFGWRWIFFVNVPIGLICYWLIRRYCPQDKPEEHKHVDVKGVLLLILAMIAIVFPLNQVQKWGFLSIPFFSFLMTGIALLGILFFIERRKSYRIFDFSFFKNRRFSLNIITRLTTQMIFLAILFFPPLFFQNLLGFSALHSGFLMLFLTLTMSVTSLFIGKWVDRKGEKAPSILASMVLLMVSLLLWNFQETFSIFYIALALVFAGFGISSLLVATISGAAREFSDRKTGKALGIYLTVAWIGCALGVAMSGTALAYESQKALLDTDHISSGTEIKVERVFQGVSPISSLDRMAQGEELVQLKKSAVQAFSQGIRANGFLFAILSLVGLISSCLLRREEIR